MQEVGAAGESPAACNLSLLASAPQLPAVRGKQDRHRGAQRAASNLRGPLVQRLGFPGEEREVWASKPQRARQRRAGTRTQGPAAQAPPQLPGRLASLFVLFLISPRPARAGLLAAVHLQQSCDQSPGGALGVGALRKAGEAAGPRPGHLKAALASRGWAAPGAATNGSPPLFK